MFKLPPKKLLTIALLISLVCSEGFATDRKPIKLLYIPLADHYAALVAYEQYRDQMKHADLSIELMGNWDLLRAEFLAEQADIACVMGPLAMDMYREKPEFRWIGLMHRDGNALAINESLALTLQISNERSKRKPDDATARVFREARQRTGKKVQIAVPHLQSTHSVVLYRYLKENGSSLALQPRSDADTLAIAIAPPQSPSFLRAKSNRNIPAAFEQSLPWADIVETSQAGYVAWYSKDVMPWPNGHVECIAIANDFALEEKLEAIQEVMSYIRIAGEDIELARLEEGESLDEIITIVRKHIPAHTPEAIAASLDHNLKVINYQSLGIDKAGLNLIMEYAVEGNILKEAIDIEDFADPRFPQSGSHDLTSN